MRVFFDVESDSSDLFRIILSSGDDAFFVQEELSEVVGNEVEIVEIDLERISGNNQANIKTLSLIAEGIATCFMQNKKAVLYYYCDDLSDVPGQSQNHIMSPQEYRSRLFANMFRRFMSSKSNEDIRDIEIVINQGDRPLFMHIIARACHMPVVERLKEYVITNYGK